MIILWILQLILIPVISPLCVGVIRTLKAKLQNRHGAPIVQPYKDLWKLFHKDETISHDASWIFRFAPMIVFGVTLVVGASIPLFGSFFPNGLTDDLLVIVYTLAIGTFFLALAGMDTGSAFGGFGSSREMTISTLAEAGLIFSLLIVALFSGTTNVLAIVQADIVTEHYAFLPSILGFTGFFIVLLAETSRFPFDNPATHLELTMIHEAMILEYSGKRLALMEWAAANKLIIFASLGVNLFFPFGVAHELSLTAVLIGLLTYGVKLFAVCVLIVLIESTMAKFRFFRLPDLLIIAFILTIVSIGLLYTL